MISLAIKTEQTVLPLYIDLTESNFPKKPYRMYIECTLYLSSHRIYQIGFPVEDYYYSYTWHSVITARYLTPF